MTARLKIFYQLEVGHKLEASRLETLSDAVKAINAQTQQPVRIHLPNGMRCDPRLFALRSN